MFASLSRWGLPPSKLPEYHYLQCSRPCPREVLPPPKLPNKIIAIYEVRAAQVGIATLEVNKVSQFTMFAPLSRWGLPPSNLPKYRYLHCSCPCPREVLPPVNLPRYRCLPCSHPCPRQLLPPPLGEPLGTLGEPSWATDSTSLLRYGIRTL